MTELGIPAKLIRLCIMSLANTKFLVKSFSIRDEVTDKVTPYRTISSTSYCKSYAVLAYADDIDIIRLKAGEVTEVFLRIEKESAKVDLTVNESRAKLMASISRASTLLDQ